jgi:hypothetical protein
MENIPLPRPSWRDDPQLTHFVTLPLDIFSAYPHECAGVRSDRNYCVLAEFASYAEARAYFDNEPGLIAAIEAACRRHPRRAREWVWREPRVRL